MLHPRFVRIGGAADELDAASFQFHHKQQVECNKSASGPDFDSGEVDGRQDIPVSLQECGPGRMLASVRGWLDAVSLENVANGCVRDAVADVGQRALNAIATPAGILFRKPNREVDDHLANVGASRLSLVRRIPFSGDQLAMPTEDRIGRKQRADFKESLAAEYLAFHGQLSALLVGCLLYTSPSPRD